MPELNKEIDVLVEIITQIEKLILTGKEVASKQLYPSLMNQIGIVFPRIVQAYMLPEYSQVMTEYTYWINQLERIEQAILSEDKFLVLDILVYETKNNLILFRNMRIPS